MATERFRKCRHSPLSRGIGKLAVPVFLLALVACTGSTAYHSYRHVPGDSGWNRGDSLAFCFPPELSQGTYTLEIGIRSTDLYPYRDIWLAAVRATGDSLSVTPDTLHFSLADNEGDRTGNRSAGGYYRNTFVCDRPLVVGKDSSGRCLYIIHVMRDNPLPGIADVGVRLVRR